MNLKVCLIVMVALHFFETLTCYGSDLDVYIEDVRVDYVNYSYVDRDTFDISVNYKAKSKNSLHIIVDVIERIPEDTIMELEVMSRIFGRGIPTGISFDASYCDTDGTVKYIYNMFVRPLGFKECPPEKGSYGNEDLSIDLTNYSVPSALFGASLFIKVKLYAPNIQLIECTSFFELQ